jgi:hypothetical protein
LGVFGVGSELVTYLPVSIDPPFLAIVPMGMATGATPPAELAPADAVSIISRIFMIRLPNSYISLLVHSSRTMCDSKVADF